jgi:imidazoleglycerol-phosphate dehydratase/histidinol-phosphatase
MKRILISKAFLELDKTESKGLISALKKLQAFGNAVNIEDYDAEASVTLREILELEDIELQSHDTYDVFITTEKFNDSNAQIIIVSSDNEIKNIDEAASLIIKISRSAEKKRETKETSISVRIMLDGSGEASINTGIGFFDHMLEQIVKHSNIDLELICEGDLHVDEHHTVEDVGIALGEAITEALGEKKGIKRYGYYLPMDDSTAKCTLDIGGRTYLKFKGKFDREKVGEFPTELVEEFFRGVASGMKANIHAKVNGKNDHHKIEALFKAFAKSLNEAFRIDERAKDSLPTTKGVL